jgi:hypothetical protein
VKTKKTIILTAILIVSFFVAANCLADVIVGPGQWGYDSRGPLEKAFSDFGNWAGIVMSWIINLSIEVFFAWLIFFRKNKKALLIVAFVNMISQPIASISYNLTHGDLSSLIIIESLVVVFEMIIYKLLIGEMTYRTAFRISFSLNLLSFVIGYIALAIIYPIYNLIYDSMQPPADF